MTGQSRQDTIWMARNTNAGKASCSFRNLCFNTLGFQMLFWWFPRIRVIVCFDDSTVPMRISILLIIL